MQKGRGIKGYKSMSKERLLSALSKSESVKVKIIFMMKDWKVRKDFNDKRLKKIREDSNELRDRFSKPQIKEIRKHLYDIKKNLENLSTQKIKETEENFFKLEKRLSNFKNYRYQDDFKHRNIRDIKSYLTELYSMELMKIITG